MIGLDLAAEDSQRRCKDNNRAGAQHAAPFQYVQRTVQIDLHPRLEVRLCVGGNDSGVVEDHVSIGSDQLVDRRAISDVACGCMDREGRIKRVRRGNVCER